MEINKSTMANACTVKQRLIMTVDSVPWPTECVELNTNFSQPHIMRLLILHMKNTMVAKVINELKQLRFLLV